MSEGPVYVYGIVRAPSTFPPPARRGVSQTAVRLVEHGSLGVLLGHLPAADFRPRREDLVAHSEVLQEVVEAGDVLPVSFGTVFASRDELESAFVEPNRDELTRMLDRMEGLVEIKVKAEYDPDVIASEVALSDRTIQKLQARAQARGDVESKIELGRRFATLLDNLRYADGRRIVRSFAPLAHDVLVGDPAGEYGVVDASFLVARASMPEVDETIERVGSAFGGRATFRCIGPLPPYSFVDAGALVVG